MAVLRGGRRIGNFDIRLGLPRDKSLVDIAKDPRLQRQPGGSGVLQRFQAEINQGEGMARPNRFLVIINPPARSKLSNAELLASEFGGGSAGTNNDLESLNTANNIGLLCNKVTMPSRDVNTQSHITYGTKRECGFHIR